jgi:hypothetical protein
MADEGAPLRSRLPIPLPLPSFLPLLRTCCEPGVRGLFYTHGKRADNSVSVIRACSTPPGGRGVRAEGKQDLTVGYVLQSAPVCSAGRVESLVLQGRIIIAVHGAFVSLGVRGPAQLQHCGVV